MVWAEQCASPSRTYHDYSYPSTTCLFRLAHFDEALTSSRSTTQDSRDLTTSIITHFHSFHSIPAQKMRLNYLLPVLAASSTAVKAYSSQSPILDAPEALTTVHTHSAFPHHSLSITRHTPGISAENAGRSSDDLTLDKVCPGIAGAYTGYLNVGEKHFFFAYFDSLSKPENDPLVMWINGGPGQYSSLLFLSDCTLVDNIDRRIGCSSMTGLLMEQGPCRVSDDGKSATKNKYSWINAANVFFLDQPIGVGFSYTTNSSIHADGTFAASEDVYAFMQLWYSAFPPSRSLPFSIAGESYGGRYIPIFAQHINEMNQISPKDQQIPLESVLIGNGIFSDTVQTTSYYDIPCTNATGTSFASMNSEVYSCERFSPQMNTLCFDRVA